MKRRNVTIILIFILSMLYVAVSGPDVQAHVTADSMPDSVAEVEYRIFLEFKPDDTKVLNKLGMVYYRMEKMSKALEIFTRVLKAEPDNFDGLDGIGLVKAAQQQYDEAISYHQRAISSNADDMAGYYHLGTVLEKKGLLVEALAAYRTALDKFNEQYPENSGGTKVVAFGKTITAAVASAASKLQVEK